MINPMIAAIANEATTAGVLKVEPLRVDIEMARDAMVKVWGYKTGDGREVLLQVEEYVRQSQYNDADRADIAQMLGGMVASNGTNDAKAFACRQLWIVGTPAELPMLSVALKDPALSHMARYAIQNMDSPEVDKVLIAALDGTDPGVQIGCINSLAMRKSPGALEAIKPLRKSKNKEIAAAAKHAIGRLEGKIAP